jgi:hypothetical protein
VHQGRERYGKSDNEVPRSEGMGPFVLGSGFLSGFFTRASLRQSRGFIWCAPISQSPRVKMLWSASNDTQKQKARCWMAPGLCS